jgi:uncharacterized membrane protein
MLDQSFTPLTFFAILGSGLIAGVFYAFSTFVMKALSRIAPAEGMAAMQSINIVVINPLFLGVFLGTALLCVVLTVGAWMRWSRPGSGFVLMGCMLYLVGTLLVTIIGNVPLNDALAKLSPSDPASVSQWTDYVSRWNVWNHLRAIAALAACASFAWGLRVLNTTTG